MRKSFSSGLAVLVMGTKDIMREYPKANKSPGATNTGAERRQGNEIPHGDVVLPGQPL